MSKFEIGDKVVNIINNKKGVVFLDFQNVEDIQKDKGQFSRKYHIVYNDGTEVINSIVEIEKVPDILDKKEKEYLKNVIKPFKDRVLSIAKRSSLDKKMYFLKIETACRFFPETEVINLPWFKGNMYQGMECNKKYTLKDLDLQ